MRSALMGPAYWIPALWVPALLVTHCITFLVLGRYWTEAAPNTGLRQSQECIHRLRRLHRLDIHNLCNL